MKSQAKGTNKSTTQESDNDVQSSDERYDDELREEVKSLHCRVNKLTKRAKRANKKNAQLSAQLARFATDLQQRRTPQQCMR